ncbi:hypothetical protein [Xylella fastidiosa]|uniref:hypothetical protein n=1 Tax=Xylella fastidiosa TaxID=2371 RepID=UPI00310161FC
MTFPDEGGKPGQKKPVEVSNFACVKCGNPLKHLVKKEKAGMTFGAVPASRKAAKQHTRIKRKPNFEKAK